ncbi:MAG: glycerate kinase, partial [Planctomycetes bacterium]|nr:glycerate kinase [Planctomycetota bacterium]
ALVPAAIAARLRVGLAGEVPETPKPGDPIFTNVRNIIIAGNETAARAAAEEASRHGLCPMILTTHLEGEARDVGTVLGGIGRSIAAAGLPIARPACIIAGGETTVTVRGPGKGGRNQEVALGAALAIDGLEDVAVVSIGTDGIDGPTDAAGAVAWGDTIARARALGMDPRRALAENDAYPFFKRLGDLISTGPTNTNVNDLAFIFAFGR